MNDQKLQAIRFEYEWLGTDVDKLVSIYGMDASLIRLYIERDRWQQKLEVPELPATNDLETFTKALKDRTRNIITVTSLYRQLELQPLYAQLETSIVKRALDLVNAIYEGDPFGANKLQSLTNTLNNLRDREPVVVSDKHNNEDSDASGIRVVIQNNIQNN